MLTIVQVSVVRSCMRFRVFVCVHRQQLSLVDVAVATLLIVVMHHNWFRVFVEQSPVAMPQWWRHSVSLLSSATCFC